MKPTYKDGWDVPGGYVEPDETPLEARRREVREELGLNLEIHRLLVTDWAPSPSEGDKVLFVFDGGTLTDAQLDAIELQADELEAFELKGRDDLAGVYPHAYSVGSARRSTRGKRAVTPTWSTASPQRRCNSMALAGGPPIT